MTDKEVCVRNRSKRSFFGFSEDRFIVFLTFALFLICQNSLAVDDEGSNRPDCIAKLISDIGDRKSHGLAEIQSSLLTDVTLEEVKALLNGRVSVYVRIVEENSWASQFGFLEFTSTGGEFNLFGGSFTNYSNLEKFTFLEIFDSAVYTVMAAALSALESGNTGFVGFVKTDQHIDWVTGEIQSVGGDGIQVLDVSGEVRKIDPAQLYWDFDKRRYLTMGLVKHIALHTFLESARYRNLEVTISFNSDNGQTIVVKGKISVLTSTDSEELKKNFLLDTTDGLFNEPAKMSVLLISEQRPYFWAIPLTRIEKVRGPLFRITE